MFTSMLMFAHVVLSILLIIIVLLQRSEGGLGSLGGGGGDALMTGSAAGNVLSRTTKWMFVVYVILTLGLSIQMAGVTADESVVDKVQQEQSQPRPVVPEEVQ